MSTTWINELKLRTIDPDREAHIAIASVPVPPPTNGHALVTWQGLPSQAVPLAWYPGPNGPDLPRQLLVMGVSVSPVPDQLGLEAAPPATVVDVRSPRAAPTAADDWAGPRWSSLILEEKKTGITMREVNELVLEHDRRRLGIRMGIELKDGGHHWWEWIQIEQLWSGPVCTAIRVAGYIPVTAVSEEEVFNPQKYNSGYWLHRHNWLFAEVYAQVFVNGLVRVTARHVNNRFFDQGRDLEGFVPVIGFQVTGDVLPSPTPLDGQRTDFDLGGVQLDIDRQTDIISPEHPGQLRVADKLVICQPYEGSELLLGDGEPPERWKVQAEERRMWKGMARSVGFDLSFADRPIRTRRYLPPYGWQGHAGALWPDRVLPARGPLEPTLDQVVSEERYNQDQHGVKPFCSGRSFQVTCMWDGEHAHGWMRNAYRTQRRDYYEAALHHAYAFADVGMDHADFTHQIVDMPKGSISLVLQRNLGMLAAYLETGDPYLLRCAESMANTAEAIDRSNWPRRSYGRDGAYIRSLIRLYDVTGQRQWLERAGEACRRAAQCQRPDGSFGDQGGTTGPHGHLSQIIKPWMNSILSEVFAIYLERAGTDPVVEQALLKTAD
ncbi:hypothetical protein HQ590_15125, partial [bacterium]|nr:hypothetical protein [bacterium]